MRRWMMALLGTLCLSVGMSTAAAAEGSYRTVMEDSMDLFTDEEEKLLTEQMEQFTQYGNAAVVTVSQNDYTSRYAREKYAELFGAESGLLFVIDMGERMIWIHCNGAVYRTIDKAYANTITDNVYRYATDGDYYRCASEVFSQAMILLEGGRIAQPMKYISNALIALVIALLANFALMSGERRRPAPAEDAAAAMTTVAGITILSRKLVRKRKTAHVEYSGSSGSSGGGGGGGGSSSGGGGPSGGGGGHRF